MRVRKLNEAPDLSPFESMFGSGYIARLPKANTQWWGCFAGGALVAVSSLEIVGGIDAFLSSCAVLPEYRGKGIQRRMIRARLRWLRKRPHFGNAVTWTHYTNPISLINLIQEGFSARAGRGDRIQLFYDLGR